MTQLPDFATNHASSEAAVTVADKVNELFRLLRENKVDGTADRDRDGVHQPGWVRAAGGRAGDGAACAPAAGRRAGCRSRSGRSPSGDSDQDARRDAAIQHHQAWLEAERDTMGFARVPTAEAKRMVEWLRSVDPDGTAKVEVRRYTGGFLHGKTYLVEDAATQAAIAGSSNMTYAGLAHNAELNLGTGGGTQCGRQGARVVRALLVH